MNALALSSYLVLIWLLLASFCLAPMEALALETTQYARVVAQAERLAYLAAQRSAFAAQVATAAVAPAPGSLAMRLVAGPVGWTALGVSAGLILAQMYYSASDLSAIKQAAAPVTGGLGYQFNGQFYSLAGAVDSTSFQQCAGGMAYLYLTGQQPAGMIVATAGGPGHTFYCPPAVPAPQTGPATAQNVEQYLGGLSSSDPQSIESHTSPVGIGAPTPPAGDTTVTQPVSPQELPTTVKPKPVPAGDTIVVDNVVPPSGSTQQTTQTQQTTTTTTTTQNPDGSTTHQEQTQATTSCAVGTHESRSFGSVLQAHQALWASSGLLSALNLLKSLTWPTTLPVVSLPSMFFGNQQVDFNQWAWFFVVLRTLVIALASLGAYRIIFVGGRT